MERRQSSLILLILTLYLIDFCVSEKFTETGKSNGTATDSLKASNLSVAATVGGPSKKKFTVVMAMASWIGAKEFCSQNNLGHVIVSDINGNYILDIRNNILKSQGQIDEPLWTGFVKHSDMWFRYTQCNEMTNRKGIFPNYLLGAEQCVMFNVTRKKDDIAWFAGSCRDKHFFVCSTSAGDIVYDMYRDKDVEGYPDTCSMIAYPSSFDDCKRRLYRYYTFAVKYINELSLCVFYETTLKDLPFNYSIIASTTTNTTVFVKANKNEYSFITPSPYTEPDSYYTMDLPCKPYQSSIARITSSAYLKVSSQTYSNTCTVVCPCSYQPLQTEIIDVPIESIKSDLKLNKRMLSSYHRRLNCAPDDRTSSKGIGVAGICVIVTVCLLIIAADVPHFVKAVRLLKEGHIV